MLDKKTITIVLIASALFSAVAVSSQSYWIDEALSLIVAQASTPAESWKFMQAVSGSTLQMPLYQIYLCAWHKVFGGGEWIMRASNIPWFLLGQLAFLLLLRSKPKLALFGCLLAAASPALWTYLDETRPYIMQYAAACWLTAGIVRLTLSEEPLSSTEVAALAVSVIVLFGSSLIGALWASGFAFAVLVMMAQRKSLRPTSSVAMWSVAVATLGLLGMFTIYYLATWQDAARGYHRSGASLLSIPFLAYELLGFGGFGPGKLQMRATPLASILKSAPALLPLAATLLALAVLTCAKRRTRPKNVSAVAVWFIALGLPALAIFAAMFLHEHRPLPRHFLPALPAVILALAAILAHALAQKSVFWRATALLLPLLWLGSAFNHRFSPAHRKEDYRTAAKIAHAALADGSEVWWAADPAAAHVYGAPIALESIPGHAWAMQAPSWEAIRFKFPPRIIALSRPDVYDSQGSVARYASENGFAPTLQLQGFAIFMREGEALPAVSP